MPALKRALIVGVFLVLGAGILAPTLDANRLRPRIQRALESALNRHVTIGKVHLNIFTGPGFSLENVLIEDDPAAGVEPFAHMELLKARVHLLSLLTGHLVFSNLKLIDGSVNLVKPKSGAWNFQALLSRAARETSHSAIPEIQISSGRLDFKFGDTKSVFFISNADLDVYPNSSGDLVIRFSGAPARTDHAAQGVGLLVARGALRSRAGSEDQLDMSVQLERTAITELVRLVDARDSGVRGFAASNMKLSGPLSHIGISGDLRIDDIHRWDLMPNQGEGWKLKYGGYLDVANQRLDVDTSSPDNQNAPVTVKFSAANYLAAAPTWTASIVFHQLPAGSLLETARHMGAPFPAGAVLDGKVDGEIGYSKPNGMHGKLAIADASLKFLQGGAARFVSAPVEIAANGLAFGPAEVRFDNDQTADLQARYDFENRSLALKIETPLLSITETRSIADRLLGTGPLPVLAQCRQGAWKGWMSLERHEDGPGVWYGSYEVQSTQVEVAGLAAPLRISSAEIEVQPGQVQVSHMRARAGPIILDGDYRHYESDRPDHIRLSASAVQLADLEHIFLPTLRRQQGFLARTFRLQRAALPDWLKQRQLEGSVQIKSLLLDDTPLGTVRARVVWNGAHLQFPSIEAHLDDMEAVGRLTVSLANALPQYKLNGQLRAVDYRNGKLDIDGVLETTGVGAALPLNARSEGTFTGTGITLGPDAEIDEVSGDFHLEPATLGPRLVLSKLQVTQGQNVLHGQGSTQADGHLVLDLTTSGRKQVRLTGMLLPMHAAPAVDGR